MAAKRRVALLIDPGLGYCRAVIRGVQSYAEKKREWTLYDAMPLVTSMPPLRDWKPHGVIAHLFNPDVATELEKMPFPIVNVTSALSQCEFPLVEVDHRKVGQLAAKFFLDQGFENFGFFGSSWTVFSLERERAFKEALRSRGFSCSSCYEEFLPRRTGEESWTKVERHIARWLRKLRKPVAVFASNDVPAKYLCNVCRNLEIDIPNDVSLLSVDNIEYDCSMARPTLSSIAIPDVRIGYEAAHMLDRMMQGAPARKTPLYLPPIGVVRRQSTDGLAADDEDVCTLLRWIRANYGQSKGIDEICASLGLGRRNVERKIRRLLGRSILEELHRIRIEAARRILAETELPVEVVARRCGFSNARRLSSVFGLAEGMSPSSFRMRCRGQIR